MSDAKCKHLQTFMVIILVLFLSFGINYHTMPKIYAVNQSFPVIFLWGFELFCCFMLIWCWLYASFADPGSIEKDLEEKGLLDKIRKGDIPLPLRDLYVCPHCKLPTPARCNHCKKCNKCFLRQNHHCDVIGQCVADKNTKAFILTFIYGILECVGYFVIGIYAYLTHTLDLISIMNIIYGILLGIILGFFFINTSMSTFESLIMPSYFLEHGFRMLTLKEGMPKLFKSFGPNFFIKMIPIQSHTTEYAWPDVKWETEIPIL